MTDDQCGGAWIKGRCTSEDAALIKATLIPLAAPQPAAAPVCDLATCQIPGCGHDGRDPRDHGTRMLDALVEGCRRLQTADLLPTSHGAVPRLTLMMSLTDLQQRAGVATSETGEQLSASAVRVLCCDAEVIPAVLGRQVRGPRRRTTTPAGHPSDLESTRRPRPALPVPALHPAAADVPRPPPPALDQRRPDQPGQPAVALRPPPSPGPRRTLDHQTDRPRRLRLRPTTRRTPKPRRTPTAT